MRLCCAAVLIAQAVVSAVAFAQTPSALPPTPPTATTAVQSESSPIAPTPAPTRAAQISYQMGQLTVIAENSSLSAILSGIAAKTGMKVTGSVADQQVFGTYGPAAPASVLSRLLEGSGTNMVLRENASTGPVELVLSPMQGMPDTFAPDSPAPRPYTPPSAYQPPPSYAQPSRPQYSAPVQPAYSPPVSINTPAPVQDQSSQPSPGMTQSPNGVPTPQQIYEQLQRLQQQRAQQPPASQ